MGGAGQMKGFAEVVLKELETTFATFHKKILN